MKKHSQHKPGLRVGIWLLALALAIWIMVIIGGATRLTGSGLSITEWKPIMGVLPPLNLEQWQEAFQKYQATPQFCLVNPDMDLAGFKLIFFWEYLHRLWGRLLGFLFAVPFVYFLWKGEFNKPWLLKLLAAFVLGGAQGFLGWFMVMSGLVDKPWVSPYRLTAHLVLALGLLAYILWLACDILGRAPARNSSDHKTERWLRSEVPGLFVLLILQIIWGGFMAGGKLALSYPSFPTLNGQWLPESLFHYQSLWHHLCEHPAPVHVIHRLLGTLLALGFCHFFWRTRNLGWKGALALLRVALPSLVLLQFLLGVLTLVHSLGRIPVLLGVMHQATAALLLGTMIVLWHQVRKTA